MVGTMAKIDDSVKKKVPELRFKGFTDDWEQRKLGDIAQINKGIQRGKQEISSVRNELNPYPVYNGGKKASGYTDEYNRENSVMVSEGGASAGYVNYYSGKYWSGGHNFTISNDTKHDTFFLLYVLQKSQEKLYKLQVGTGLPNIQLKSIKDFPIYSTSNTEQAKVGSFFKQLDKTIALHQRKLDLLKEQKKGFLQKMFPKNGAKVPELRFKGFTDDWEERKFSKLAEVRRGLTYKPSDVQKYGIRVLRSSNIAEDTFLIKSDDVFVNKEAVKIDKVKNGDILITAANGSNRLVGKHALIEGIENDTVHGGFMLVARAEKPEFVNAIMSSSWYSKFINIFVSGGNGAIGNLSKSDLENQKVYVPSEIEQQKIGSFFKQLDDTIALHQRKLDLLKEQKKGFLQKMFV